MVNCQRRRSFPSLWTRSPIALPVNFESPIPKRRSRRDAISLSSRSHAHLPNSRNGSARSVSRVTTKQEKRSHANHLFAESYGLFLEALTCFDLWSFVLCAALRTLVGSFPPRHLAFTTRSFGKNE